MLKKGLGKWLDYMPLFILIVSAVILLSKVVTENIALVWKHYLGLALLGINSLFFFWRHKIAVLALGLLLLSGLLGILSYSPAITTSTLYYGRGDKFHIPLFHGQSIFLVWLLIHFVVSGRHYVGLLTKKYWNDLLAGIESRSNNIIAFQFIFLSNKY